MAAEEKSPKLCVLVLLTSEHFPGCILGKPNLILGLASHKGYIVRRCTSSGLMLPGSQHHVAFGKDLEAESRRLLREDTGLNLPEKSSFKVATCLDYPDLKPSGTDDVRLLVRAEIPRTISCEQSFTFNNYSWSWEAWDSIEENSMSNDLRRLRASGAFSFPTDDHVDI